MRIMIIALGSRGDVQPYIALGVGLQAAGHMVRMVTHENYEQLVQAHGLEFWPAYGNIQEFAETPEMRALLEKGNFIALMHHAAEAAKTAALSWGKVSLQASQGMDFILAGLGGLFIGLALAEKLNLPLLQAHYVPFTPTSEFPGALMPPAVARLGGTANRISHHLTRQILWQQVRSADQAARQQVFNMPAAPFLGLFNDKRLQNSPVLYGFSPSVIAKPADWSAKIHVTGYWFLDSEADFAPPPALEAFLQDGPPPVYIGFGSMSSRRPEETTRLILQALAQSGQRAVLLSGWNGMQAEKLPENVYVVDAIPHDWLFARVAVVVHHGGAGTTAAGLRAGVPSILIPFFADQPFWGQRVAALGVGPQPIPRKKLSVDLLSQAITKAVTDQGMRQKAAKLGEKIRAEDGVAQAVRVIQQIGTK